jgi:hypothetical protein
VRIAGWLYHTSGIGDLMTSLYAAGRAEYRSCPNDPSPGVPSLTAVMPQLNLGRLDQVVSIDAANDYLIAQARCRLDGIVTLLRSRGLALAAPSRLADTKTIVGAGAYPHSVSGRKCPLTVGSAVIAGTVAAEWADALTKDGMIRRYAPAKLPPDALILAAALLLSATLEPIKQQPSGQYQRCSGTIAMQPHGHSAAQIPHPLQ